MGEEKGRRVGRELRNTEGGGGDRGEGRGARKEKGDCAFTNVLHPLFCTPQTQPTDKIQTGRCRD